METTSKSRPTGVTIIGILTIIGGILMRGSGIALAAVSAVLPNLASMSGFESQIPSMIPVSYLGVISVSIGSIS
jgi:hypothetical protein